MTSAQRNIAILMACQLVSVSATVLVVTIGGLVGTWLAPSRSLATLPLSLMVVGTALSTVLAAMLMQRIGRRRGFAVGALVASGAAALGALAIFVESFALFCVGGALIGVNNAFVQQYRFAAAESVDAARAGQAISLILAGAIGGALFGPYLAVAGKDWIAGRPYAGALLAVTALQLGAATVLLGIRERRTTTETPAVIAERPLRAVVTQPAFVTAVLAGVVGYGVMTLIMTATPLSMHVTDRHSLAATARVIRSHVLAMYVPSLFSGQLIARFGVTRIMGAGVLAMFATVATGLQGHTVMHYWWALVALGLGWNFLYVGGTAMLVETYHPHERFSAQAVNEFSVFGMSALASLVSGSLIYSFGWTVLLLCAVPLLAAMSVALIWRARSPVPH